MINLRHFLFNHIKIYMYNPVPKFSILFKNPGEFNYVQVLQLI